MEIKKIEQKCDYSSTTPSLFISAGRKVRNGFHEKFVEKNDCKTKMLKIHVYFFNGQMLLCRLINIKYHYFSLEFRNVRGI